MCGKNIVTSTYNHGGMLVAITTNVDNMARTAREMTEAQRDSYEALTENLAAFQRRSVGLAQGGLGFIKLQEENARAAQQWFASSVRVAQLQQRSLGFVQDWVREGAEALREQTEHNVRTAELRTSVLSALETDNYDTLTVAEVTEKLDGLSADELKKLREFEKRNKDRESLVERIDSKIRANS